MSKKVSDETIISALLAHGTIRSAAAAAGISERTIYNRLHDRDFMPKYKAAKSDIIRAAVFNLNSQIQAAVDVVVSIMSDQDNNPQIRLNAAEIIMRQAGRFADRLQTEENSVAADFDPWFSS